jgi:hypothetical protein
MPSRQRLEVCADCRLMQMSRLTIVQLSLALKEGILLATLCGEASS